MQGVKSVVWPSIGCELPDNEDSVLGPWMANIRVTVVMTC